MKKALRVANNTEYGLTGSVYTNNPTQKAAARQRFHVGNLYFNRKCTGAMVGAHPFGGFNMSGTDSKAGGPDYLYPVHAGQKHRGKTYGRCFMSRFGIEAGFRIAANAEESTRTAR